MKKFFTLLIMALFSGMLFACEETEVEPTIYEISTEWSDALDLQAVEYEGREFLKDGIGEVTLDRCIDGDTTYFTYGGIRPFSVRYLGIDTRESTAQVQPWGFAASDYNCELLTAADTIVLEMDASAGRTDNYGRYLAYVWADGKLVNLQMVEQAFAPAVGTGGLKYGDDLFAAQTHAKLTGLKIWGETDPSFIGDPLDVTMEELLENPENYRDRFLNVEGTITARDGGDFYFGDDSGSIFVFTQDQISSIIADEFTVGSSLILNDVYLTDRSGEWQLTNFNIREVTFP